MSGAIYLAVHLRNAQASHRGKSEQAPRGQCFNCHNPYGCDNSGVCEMILRETCDR